ncbi:hypothetical protein PsorP6_014137 [Peronosclerospora sorghi]|uniref:Uncharacterized protein n=1 Tax=Peronosclerospora sorghi TaxID=230839 RepID=A0ACC0VKX3_9STRA|nr:hypothetical protein PsorP6_014137 [Peronosclerospora sorghi]
MVKLYCAVVGVKGSAFSVKIDASESVGELKEAIATKQKYDFATSKLQLFLAWKNGAWLESRSNDVEKLKQGELTTAIEELTKENKQVQGEDGLQEVLNGKPPPKLKQIHVLFIVPEGRDGSPNPNSRDITVHEADFDRDSPQKKKLEYYQELGRLIQTICKAYYHLPCFIIHSISLAYYF